MDVYRKLISDADLLTYEAKEEYRKEKFRIELIRDSKLTLENIKATRQIAFAEQLRAVQQNKIIERQRSDKVNKDITEFANRERMRHADLLNQIEFVGKNTYKTSKDLELAHRVKVDNELTILETYLDDKQKATKEQINEYAKGLKPEYVTYVKKPKLSRLLIPE